MSWAYVIGLNNVYNLANPISTPSITEMVLKRKQGQYMYCTAKINKHSPSREKTVGRYMFLRSCDTEATQERVMYNEILKNEIL